MVEVGIQRKPLSSSAKVMLRLAQDYFKGPTPKTAAALFCEIANVETSLTGALSPLTEKHTQALSIQQELENQGSRNATAKEALATHKLETTSLSEPMSRITMQHAALIEKFQGKDKDRSFILNSIQHITTTIGALKTETARQEKLTSQEIQNTLKTIKNLIKKYLADMTNLNREVRRTGDHFDQSNTKASVYLPPARQLEIKRTLSAPQSVPPTRSRPGHGSS